MGNLERGEWDMGLKLRRRVAGGLLLGASVAGCGGAYDAPPRLSVHEVTGQVLLADGKPLQGGTVYFVPRDGVVNSEGKIGGDGGFSLITGGSGEGAPEGEYKVRIEPADVSRFTVKTPRRKRPPFPPRHLDEDTSGLTARVKAGTNALAPFILK